jgi:serine/threonine-protein kinase
MSTPVPKKIGKYDVTGVIGRGGMGVVYEATDPQLDRRVAIKMITGAFAENQDMLKRFNREAQALGSLQHPNIVTVYDLGTHEGNPYLVMQYLEGESLDAALTNRRQLSLLDKINIVICVCQGLGYAHRRSVTHRDIKPANIMLCKDGGIKIFDFGIAHAGDQTVTRTGEIIGTLKYMAPEQVNSKSTDHRADLFSTGVVLYQLITNHLPFEGDTTAGTILKIVHDPPPPLNSFLTAYPPEIEQILLRAMAKNPNDRYSSADEFAFDLEHLLGQLREELIGREMREVASLLDRGEVYEAQGSLLRVLKVDHQHSSAMRLLREVQQRIQRYEIGKQILGLRVQAEKALADERFEEAQEYVDRALVLDPRDPDLNRLRETICGEALRTENLNKALNIAHAAQAEGNLDAAKRAAEEALALAPNSTEAKTLYRLISREFEERSRRRQIDGYVREARQEISSRRFTAAFEILRQAEELDPFAPEVQSLLGLAVAGREQERRRAELETATREIQDALGCDDYLSARRKAEEALARFPEERTLVKLHGLADRYCQLEERKKFIDQQLAMARQLLQAGRNEELKNQLEEAVAQIGPEPRLQSLIEIVADNLQRERAERRKSEEMQRAIQSLNSQAFDDAIRMLEPLATEFGEDVEIRSLLARAQSEQAEAVRDALGRAEQQSDLFLRLATAKSKRDRGDLQGAIGEIRQALEAYPDEQSLRDLQAILENQIQQAMEAARREEARRTEEAYVLDVISEAQRTFALRERVLLLEKALRQKPQEIRLQQELSAARGLQHRVTSLESEAHELEQSAQYDQAVAKWEALATVYPSYPGLDQILDRARRKHQQVRLEARSSQEQAHATKNESPREEGSGRLGHLQSEELDPHRTQKLVPEGKHRTPAIRTEQAGKIENTTIFAKSDLRTRSERVPSDALPALTNDALNGDKLQIIERHLAAIIGPMAKVLVKQAAGKTTNGLELYSMIAAHLEQEEDRRAFLATGATLGLNPTGMPPSKAASKDAELTPGQMALSAVEITSVAIEQAASALAAYLGPIATVLAKKEAKRAATLWNLYELLAEHVADSSERARFLQMATALKNNVTPSGLS